MDAPLEHEDLWHDGDLISIEFIRKDGTTNEKWYDYVREDGYWPGTYSWSSQNDSDISEAIRAGHAKLLRCGLEPEQAETAKADDRTLATGCWTVAVFTDDKHEDTALLFVVPFADELEARRFGDRDLGDLTGEPYKTDVKFTRWGEERG